MADNIKKWADYLVGSLFFINFAPDFRKYKLLRNEYIV